MNLTEWRRHFLLLICSIFVAIIHTVSSETRVVCYYTNWSVYRPGTAKFSPQNINPYLCTHLIYAFGGFTKENSLKPFDKYQDIEKGGYAKFTGLKTYNKNLKTMLAIGGWNEGSSRFSPMVASSERRKELVKNTVKFLRQNHFDGLDLDWEYPNFRDGGKARDKENYAQLVQELREEFDRESEKTGRPRLLLTMAVPAGIEYINKGYDIPKLNRYLDWMNILSYDYHSAFEPAVNHHAPLYPLEEDNEYNFDGDLNIDHTVKHYLKLGADSSKLVLGIPTYGRSYTLFNPDANELGAPADGPGDMGDATRENGYLAFYEICENLKENDWKVVQPKPDAMGPYAYKDNQWVSYDDELIVKKKSVYVAENNLGGIMFWSIDNDDFRGHCYNKPYPLIEAAKEALLTAASSKTEENLVKPRKQTTRLRRPSSSTTKENKQRNFSTTRVQNSGGPQSFEDIPTSSQKRTRPTSRGKPRSEETQIESQTQEQGKRIRSRGQSRRRKTTTQPTTVTSTTPSTLPTTPMYKTPEPPTTPDPGGDFKCEEDGFFPHPRDCKKYFWCLSGPADLGIIAHQFTCPAGLYFNKAADSCDYTQNVLCKKKLQTTSTTTSSPSTTSTTTTTSAPSFSTRRIPARITAATSKTTFLYTTTSSTTPEPEYYDEYEYEDEEDDAPRRREPDSEEDPRVIKELIDLIKKVGGVEELEKFLKLQDDGSMAVTHSGSTTPASISRSLYERVLQSRANAAKGNTNTVTDTNSRNSLLYSTINRNRQSLQNEELEKPETFNENTVKRSNSRFTPQNADLEKSEIENDSSVRRGRPQYTTISRQRASTERVVESENESEDGEVDDEQLQTKKRQFTSRKQNTPEYVTIKRSRPTSSTDPDEEDEESYTRSSFLRSRQRGIPGETDVDVIDPTQHPEYVTIQRNKSTAEEITTSKYTTIQRRRPPNESSDDVETSIDPEANKHSSTTQVSQETSPEKEKRYRSTTLLTTIESATISTPNTDATDKEPIVTEKLEVKSTLEETTDSTADKTATQIPVTELLSSSMAIQSTTEGSTEAFIQIMEQKDQKEANSEKNPTSPQLSRPRPFTTRTRSTTTTKPTDTASTKKPSRPFFFRRPSLRFTPGRAALSTSPAPPSTTTQRPARSTPRRRFTSRDNSSSNGNATVNSGLLGTSASQQIAISTTAKPRFKFASRRPFLKKGTSSTSTESTSTSSTEVEDFSEDDIDDNSNETNDQMLEPSIQRVKSQEHQENSNAIRDLGKEKKNVGKDSLEQIGDIGLSLNPLQKVVPGRRRQTNRGTPATTTTTEKQNVERNPSAFDRLRTRQRNRFASTAQTETTSTTSIPPSAAITHSTLRRRRPQPQAFDRVVSTEAPIIVTTGSYRPITIEYDYYDEGDVRILGQLPANSKVLIHASGAIQCLDQGNFPHPVSCKKFISCAKMENGEVIGWEYTCPHRLSFDPVGGICNWSAGLGCKE